MIAAILTRHADLQQTGYGPLRPLPGARRLCDSRARPPGRGLVLPHVDKLPRGGPGPRRPLSQSAPRGAASSWGRVTRGAVVAISRSRRRAPHCDGCRLPLPASFSPVLRCRRLPPGCIVSRSGPFLEALLGLSARWPGAGVRESCPCRLRLDPPRACRPPDSSG